MTRVADRRAAADALRAVVAGGELPPERAAYLEGFAAGLDVSCVPTGGLGALLGGQLAELEDEHAGLQAVPPAA